MAGRPATQPELLDTLELISVMAAAEIPEQDRRAGRDGRTAHGDVASGDTPQGMPWTTPRSRIISSRCSLGAPGSSASGCARS